jgi:hypothetical protein
LLSLLSVLSLSFFLRKNGPESENEDGKSEKTTRWRLKGTKVAFQRLVFLFPASSLTLLAIRLKRMRVRRMLPAAGWRRA